MAFSTVCAVKVGERVAQLSVACEGEDAWRWTVRFEDREYALAQGVSEAKLAAKIAAQLALERWMYRSNRGPQMVLKYRWAEQVG